MKKIAFVLTSVTLFSVLANSVKAQDSNVGFHGGVNISNLKFEQHKGNHASAGLIGGFYYGYNFNTLIGAQIGADFTVSGTEESGRETIPETGETYDWNFELDLYNIRVPLTFTVSPCDWLRFHIGPQFSFCTSGELFDTKAADYGGQVRYKLMRKDYNIFDIQALAGVDFRFYEHFVIAARYQYGFRSALKDNVGYDHEILEAGKSFNRGITLTVGLEF